MPNNNPLNAVEQQSIAKAILNIINTNYTALPVSKIQYQSLDTRKSSMAIYNLSNSAVDKLYINGSYLATYRFSVVYRSIHYRKPISCILMVVILQHIGFL